MSNKTTHGQTQDGQEVHVNTLHHMRQALSLKGIGADVKKVEGMNAKLAVILTRGVGSMACAYIFALLALAGLPGALKPGGMGFVPWFAQTFLQLVLLSVIMVGQSVQSAASDTRATKTFEDIEVVVDRLDTKTEGGIKEILDAVKILAPKNG
jgi:hypothetical protein